ncbi:hypothetical protein JOF53_007182 [Crossiella equi]|uniref:Lipoprotein n=1 Tax=Crossiella equi TaxID=130796 RepID=A0ABS5AP47_9PSEU|nr:hypothetical protein [Crossiella equi]MBP2478310.1 hypothetical protein [Crossiella equi]
MHRPVLTLLAVVLAAGCSTGPAAAPLPVKLLVRDGALREIGGECSGTGPFRAIHHTAAYRVTDGTGAELATGKLPAGKAVKALDEPLSVPREPSFCQLEFTVQAPPAESYRLVVGDLAPIDLNRDPAKGPDAPLVGLTT